ncbi:MAG: PHP domain-containing protein [Candidatus Marinimicrobia bacterium]|nr:PHP domain-containing protein [Candidatus Neomarinimicrobiota bacterium]
MIDLHTHSTFSDGTLTPEELVATAQAAGVTALALTDHDTTAGVPRFLAAAATANLRAWSGVEISADFPVGTMHILGYGFDSDDARLEQQLAWLRGGREARNREILEKLRRLGLTLTWEEVRAHAGEDVVGRPHFAQALIDRGYVRGKEEAFDLYLARGKPAYADRRRLSPEDSLALIRDAGGVPVLAHPATLELNAVDLRDLVARLTVMGLEGLEVHYAEHSPNQVRQYRRLTRDFQLLATGGTDYHGSLTPQIKPGRGFGKLVVPETTVDELNARLQSKRSARLP